MSDRVTETWQHIAGSPFLWVALTLGAYVLACRLFIRSGNNPLVNPVAISVVVLVVFLSATGTSYQTYYEGGKLIHFLLGPITVALAVPLFNHLRQIRSSIVPIIAALAAGSTTAIVSTTFMAFYLGVSDGTILSLMPKFVTAPIAMGIAEKTGGTPQLTAVFVVITAIFGAMTATCLLKFIGIEDDRSKGFSIGISSQGIGTARAFQISEEAGAFSTISMSLCGLLAAILIPLLYALS